MVDSSSVTDYAMPVHRSLVRRDLIAGVSRLSFAVVIAITYFGIVELKQLIFIGIGPALFFIIRALTKEDEYLFDIILYSLLSPDNLYP